MHLISKLQADAVNSDVPVSHLLRTAKIVATKLDLKDALLWIDRELTGYTGSTAEDLPSYRRLSGNPKGWNPYHGWQPIYFLDAECQRLFSQARIGQALGSIEQTFNGGTKVHYSVPYPPGFEHQLRKSLDDPTTEICIQLTYSSLSNIVDQVRNLILNWSLELEKVGIVGEDMTFTADEKREAGPVSQNFFIQKWVFLAM